MIRILKNSEIDRKWWDDLISDSVLRQDPYPYSWYLDIMCPGWMALYDESIPAICPLPNRRKMFVDYVYTPFFLQRLGVYSPRGDKSLILTLFIDLLQRNYRMVDLNIFNKPEGESSIIMALPNYYIELAHPYPDIANNFTAKCKRDIKLALNTGQTLVEKIPSSDAIDLFRLGPGKSLGEIGEDDYARLRKLMDYCCSSGKGDIIGVYENSKLIYSLFYILYAGKLTALFISTSDKSRIKRSGYFVINSLIERNAGKELVFDFAGSNLQGVQKFIKAFGSSKEEYYRLYLNNLGFPHKQIHCLKNKLLNR